jgi:predicted membrane protein
VTAAVEWTRAVSLAVGLALSALLMLYPYALGTTMTPMLHTALPLLLLGVSAALVHGVGFRPENKALAVAFSPVVAWPLILLGGALLVFG